VKQLPQGFDLFLIEGGARVLLGHEQPGVKVPRPFRLKPWMALRTG